MAALDRQTSMHLHAVYFKMKTHVCELLVKIFSVNQRVQTKLYSKSLLVDLDFSIFRYDFFSLNIQTSFLSSNFPTWRLENSTYSFSLSQQMNF